MTSYLEHRLKLFSATYKTNLALAVEKHPDEYAWTLDELDTVHNRMMEAINSKGILGVNIDSHAYRWTCKDLSINHTYKAINQFLKEEQSHANDAK